MQERSHRRLEVAVRLLVLRRMPERKAAVGVSRREGRMTTLTDRRLKALREMADDFLDLVQSGEVHDHETSVKIALLGGALAGFVPELLAEIERLKNGRITRYVKMDAMGGNA